MAADTGFLYLGDHHEHDTALTTGPLSSMAVKKSGVRVVRSCVHSWRLSGSERAAGAAPRLWGAWGRSLRQCGRGVAVGLSQRVLLRETRESVCGVWR